MRLLWKILSGAVAVVVVLVVGIALWSQDGARHISAAADQFRVPEGWVVLSERVEAPDLVCFGGNPCPSLRRQWRAPTDMTASEISKLIASSGWNLKLETSCEPRSRPHSSGLGPVVLEQSCSADGQVDGYAARLYYDSSSANPAMGTLTLSLR